MAIEKPTKTEQQSTITTQEPKMEKKIVYAVRSNQDLTEGRGAEYTKCICELYDTAVRLGKHGYVQGKDCPIVEMTLYKFGDQWYTPASTPVEPSMADLVASEARAAKEHKQARRAKLIEKLKAAGVTEDDLALLTEKD